MASASGWDSAWSPTPSSCAWGADTHVFYNGGDMGRAGFGVATLERW